VRADKLREVTAGHDGTWVAHPALIPVAMEVFNEHMPTPNQHHVLRKDVSVTRDQLIAPCSGTITRAGFENNVEVCVRYLAAWLDGNGCVPIHNLMEDAATAEISRTQIWQWIHVGNQHLDDGTAIDLTLLDTTLKALPSRLGDTSGLPGAGRIGEAIGLLDQLSRNQDLLDFLTLPAYARID
jgi:malate synthase